MKTVMAIALACACLTGVAQATEPLMIHNAWVREMPPGTQNAAAYMMLHNASDKARRVVAADTTVAERTELHTVKQVDGVMKMMQLDGLDVPSQGMASLEPGGNHVMLLGVQDRLIEGQAVLITLRYANGETQTVELPVKRGEPMQHGEHKMNHDNN